MLYASQASLIKRYTLDVLLSIARNTDRTLDETKVQEALEDASQTIDSYLAGRYRLPLQTVPAVLERHCCYIARYFLEKTVQLTKLVWIMKIALSFWKRLLQALLLLGYQKTMKRWKRIIQR